MKRILLTITALLTFAPVAMQAQDTVRTGMPMDNYYYNDWFEIDSTYMTMPTNWINPENATVYSIRVELGKDTIPVYGIAAALETYLLPIDTLCNFQGERYPDSSRYWSQLEMMTDTSAYDEAYEDFGLYLHVGDSLQLASPQLRVNIKTTPVSFYVDFGTPETYPFRPGERTRPFPIYEMYFDSAVTMQDSFYIGMTCHVSHMPGIVYPQRSYTWPIQWRYFVVYIGGSRVDVGREYVGARYNGHWSFARGMAKSRYFIFPILDAERRGRQPGGPGGDDPHGGGDTIIVGGGDTIIVGGGDTLGIDSPWQRLAVVMPNPATTTARVMCSAGLQRVEAFNASGVRMADWRADGYEHVVDVSSWPSGTYILRLTTPLGVVGKRLVVDRR